MGMAHSHLNGNLTSTKKIVNLGTCFGKTTKDVMSSGMNELPWVEKKELMTCAENTQLGCIDIRQRRNYEVIKACVAENRVLKWIHTKRLKTITIRDFNLSLVTDGQKSDYFSVFMKIHRRIEEISCYYVVCFTKEIDGKMYCLGPKLEDCYKDKPSSIRMTVHELPSDWSSDTEEIPEDHYKYWFQYNTEKDGYNAYFSSFHNAKYLLKVDDKSLILERRERVRQHRLPMAFCFEYLPAPHVNDALMDLNNERVSSSHCGKNLCNVIKSIGNCRQFP